MLRQSSDLGGSPSSSISTSGRFSEFNQFQLAGPGLCNPTQQLVEDVKVPLTLRLQDHAGPGHQSILCFCQLWNLSLQCGAFCRREPTLTCDSAKLAGDSLRDEIVETTCSTCNSQRVLGAQFPSLPGIHCLRFLTPHSLARLARGRSSTTSTVRPCGSHALHELDP